MTAVFFDLDNTLVDHSGAERVASMFFYEAIADRTSVSSPEEFAELWNRAQDRHMNRYVAGEISFQEQRRERISEVLETKFSDAEADDLFSIYLERYENCWRAYPDVLPCLESLRVDHIMVITNGDAAQQHKKLLRTGLAASPLLASWRGTTPNAVRGTRSRLVATQKSRNLLEQRTVPIGLLDESVATRVPTLELIERLFGVAARHDDW